MTVFDNMHYGMYTVNVRIFKLVEWFKQQEHLLVSIEALSSNPSTSKRKKSIYILILDSAKQAILSYKCQRTLYKQPITDFTFAMLD
jgi:hypothetical protein